MTKEDLYAWAQEKMWDYHTLNELYEETIDGTEFLILPVQYGVFKGLYICFSDTPTVADLRRQGYAVAVVSDYKTAQKLLFECVKFIKNKIGGDVKL